MLQIHVTTSIHKLCILYQCLFCWGGGGAVTNPCYNLNTQTMYLVSVPFLLGGGLLQIHITTSIHKLCILYQCLFGGPKLVHICAFEWYTKTTSAGTLTHWGRDKTVAILHFIRWKFSYFDSSFNEVYSCQQYTSIGYQIMAWRRAGSKPLSELLIA